MTFRVGMKVVCVDAKKRRNIGWVHPGLVRGRIYEIEGFSIRRDGGIGLTFGFDPGWPYYPDRFRPVVERKTDISALKALLVPGARILEGSDV